MGVLQVDEATYRGLNRWSWSTAKHVLDCPAEALDQRQRPISETDAMKIGTLMHALILEPETVGDRYMVVPEIVKGLGGWTYSNAGVTWRTKKEAEAALFAGMGDRVPVTRALMTECELRCKGPREAVEAWGVEAEVAMIGQIEGCAAKGKADGVSGRILLDVKTTADVKPDAIGRAAVQRRWLGQLWTYRELAKQSGFAVEEVGVMVVQAPKASGNPLKLSTSRQPRRSWRTLWLDDHALRYGESEGRRVWRAIRDCEAAEDWPDYPTGPLVLPRWAREVEIEEEVF